MNFLADENVERHIVVTLRNAGHTVAYVPEMSPSISDATVIETANNSNSILITNDKDFGELLFRQNKISEGVILLRLEGISNETKAKYVLESINKHKSEMAKGFTVISPGVVRIRVNQKK